MDAHEIAGAPGLGAGISMMTKTYEMMKNVKVYRRRCENVYRQCLELRVALQESAEVLEGTSSIAILDEVDSYVALRFVLSGRLKERPRLIRQVESKAAEWSQYSYTKSFLSQSEIQEGLVTLDQRMRNIGIQVSIKMGTDTARSNNDMRIAQRKDQMELRDLLARLVKDVEDVKKLVTMESPTHPVVEEVMESLQTELRQPDLKPDHEEVFKRGLWMLHQKTHKLPPLIDLTGQVKKISTHRIASGTYNDVYMGRWLGQEKVALRVPCLPLDSHGFHRRFEKDLTIWRKLDHPNVVPLYGIFYEESDIYSVSPWMENGTISTYLKNNPDADRLTLILQVATGLEYLHQNGIIHGDLRAANILISEEGVACICDFGMSKMLEDVDRTRTASPGRNPRWCAPELLEENATISKHTDIWSFAMACLEILTGELPFVTIKAEKTLYQLLGEGKHPQRPHSPPILDPLWLLLKKCWQKSPNSRPSISAVKQQITEIRAALSAPRSPTTSSASLSSSSSRRRTSLQVLGFQPRRPEKRRDSSSSNNSSVSGDARPFAQPAHFVAEPEPISRSYSSGHSSKAAPRLEVHVELDEWRIDLEPATSASSSNDSQRQDTVPEVIPPVVIIPSPVSEHTHLPRSATSESSSNYSSSTRAACLDSNIIINLLRDGTVASGTLEGLVERLIQGFGLRRDVEFRDILLSSTVDFVSAEEFFGLIERRFEDADQVAVPGKITTQYNILSVLLYWVSTPHLPLEDELISQMRAFCQNAKSKISSDFMKEKADKIITDLNKKSRMASLPPPTAGPALAAADMHPRDLAIGLTLMESDKFKQIYPSDYLMFLNGHLGSDVLAAAKEVHLKIVKFALKSILHFNDVLHRADVMKFFLNTAKASRFRYPTLSQPLTTEPQECLQLHNFSSAIAIATAFDSPLIDGLSYTRDQLQDPMRQILRRLLNLLTPGHQTYRADLSVASTQSADFVPWLAVHISDLRKILAQHPETLEHDHRTLINFERYIHFRNYLQTYIPSSHTAYADLQRFRNTGQLAYVEARMNGIVLNYASDVELETRASELKRAEIRERNHRTIERERLGFRKHSRKSS
ncbi:hypothetical protein NP233_g7743 [Leucocoprinus birnbaumii]|uniref:Non-specific serine/threonine protein kinase n=1 Tax=Leucocoprinus birnbaumii TaxID=56174 RepID=A0AAD5VPF6_9AGAR|nr:hypothetical protein NP233_g7743 [Leucocoprinus birnbaumii]